MIDTEQVKHIAQLARLVVTDEEARLFTKQLGSILEYVEKLNTVDTTGIELSAYASPRHDPLRNDELQGSIPSEKLLQNGPVVKKGCFAVPRVIAL
jgi:aspartyl-tRNA(Asn)/glutamyl-tRNA(Gln) amidotransferase subunit C